jgi:hypothetical protein
MNHLRTDLAAFLPQHTRAVNDLLALADRFPEVQEILEPYRPRTGGLGPSRKSRRRRPRRGETAVLQHVVRAAEEMQAALVHLEDPPLAQVSDELARRFRESNPPQGSPPLIALRQDINKLGRIAEAMLVKGKPGRPPERAREWLERQIVEVLVDAGIALKGKRGRPSLVPQVIATVLAHVGYRSLEGKRLATTRRVLRLFAEVARAKERGELQEIHEFTPFEQGKGDGN